MNVSCMQLSVVVKKRTSGEEINDLFKHVAATDPEILGYIDLPLVSCDFNHDPRSAVIDGNQTSVCNHTLVNVMAWFDNEWGFANRMIDTVFELKSL